MSSIIVPSNSIIQAPSVITSKQPWRQQPQTAVEVDWTNPLTRGLVHAVNGNKFYDFVTNTTLIKNAQSIKPTAHGLGMWANTVDSAGATETSRIITSDGVGTGDFTIFFYGAPPASTTRSVAVGSSDGVGGGVYEPYVLINENNSFAATSGLFTFTLSGSTSSAGISGAVDGNLKLFAGVRRGGVLYAYAGNTSATGGVQTTSIVRSSMKFHIGGYISSITQGANQYGVILAGAFNRALSAAEISVLNVSPWQIFRPLNRISYFLPPLYEALDETTASDTDYISSSTSGQIARVGLGATTDPGVDTGHVLRYRADSDGDRGVIARVVETGSYPFIIPRKQVWTQQPQTEVQTTADGFSFNASVNNLPINQIVKKTSANGFGAAATSTTGYIYCGILKRPVVGQVVVLSIYLRTTSTVSCLAGSIDNGGSYIESIWVNTSDQSTVSNGTLYLQFRGITGIQLVRYSTGCLTVGINNVVIYLASASYMTV